MTPPPASRSEALLDELCAVHGWCLEPAAREALLAGPVGDAESVTEAILRAELGPDHLSDRRTLAWLRDLVDDWLVDPEGRGARSGLPD